MTIKPIFNRARFWRLLRYGLLLVLAVAAGLEIAIRRTEIPEALRSPEPQTAQIVDRDGRAVCDLGTEGVRRSYPIGASQLNRAIRLATLAAEDHRFERHAGLDAKAVLRASLQNLRQGRIVSGASTITQQLVKLAESSEQRDFSTKLHECLAALAVEREWSKDTILLRYLNRIDYGNGNRGIESAARSYFGKSASELALPEAVFLAGLPHAPSRLNPRKYPERANRRFFYVANRLRELNWLTEDESALLAEPPVIEAASITNHAPHFTRRVRAAAEARTGTTRTTLDLDLQRKVEAILARHLDRLREGGGNARHAAAVVLDHQDGSVRAWCGSGNWSAPGGQIDGVTTPRSAGSTLKPFLYLRLIDQRMLTAASLLPDTPDAIRTVYPDYDPRNYDDRYWGPVRVREALANSLNVPAVVALSMLGADEFTAYLGRCGIHPARGLDEYGAGLILGNAEIRLLDLAAAFSAFNGSGVAVRPRLLTESAIRHLAISSPEASRIVADILADNEARRKAFGPFSPLAFDARVPCKTGTSSGFRDAWTVGLTGRHVVGVWFGNLTGAPMREIASVSGPAPAWREIVDFLLPADGGVSDLDDQRDGLVRAQVCPLSGLLPDSPERPPIPEWFLPGTVPVRDAGAFFDQAQGGKALLPPEYAIWIRSAHNYLGASLQDTPDLQIVAPRDGSSFVIDPGIPAARQQIELIATGGSPDAVVWTLNGEPVSQTLQEPRWFCTLKPGRHCLVAQSGASRCQVHFEVSKD